MGLSGGMHWIIILIIVLVLFGAGRVSNLMGELGKGMKSFKQGLNDDDEAKARQQQMQPPQQLPPQQLPPQAATPQPPIDITPRPADPVAPPPPPASSTDQPL